MWLFLKIYYMNDYYDKQIKSKKMTFPKSNNNLSLLLKEFDTTSKYFDIIKKDKKNIEISSKQNSSVSVKKNISTNKNKLFLLMKELILKSK